MSDLYSAARRLSCLPRLRCLLALTVISVHALFALVLRLSVSPVCQHIEGNVAAREGGKRVVAIAPFPTSLPDLQGLFGVRLLRLLPLASGSKAFARQLAAILVLEQEKLDERASETASHLPW